jgi:hypothetical protein
MSKDIFFSFPKKVNILKIDYRMSISVLNYFVVKQCKGMRYTTENQIETFDFHKDYAPCIYSLTTKYTHFNKFV